MNPPPPPPHGDNPKSSGLPPGKYDIFIIPEHSAGSGFLYLPSLRPNVNSFAAGFASALILVVIGQALAPVVQSWWNGVKGSGGMGMLLLMFGIAVGAWALGRTQNEGGPGPGGGGDGGGSTPGAGGNQGSQSHTNSNGYANGHANGHAGGAPQPGPPPGSGQMPGAGPGAGSKPSWQRNAPPPSGASGAAPKPSTPSSAAKGAWEKAREETKKKEEERRAKEADQKRREELDKRLKELREKEAREREAREKKQQEAEGKTKSEREKAEREKALKEKLENAAREAKERAGSEKPKGSTYAYSAMGEKVNPWPQGRPNSPPSARPSPSPTKRPPPPTARTYLGTDEDAYSYRPYDKPKKPMHKKSHSSLYSESSYAASYSTSRTTPPPSQRGPYSTKDPDKIVIKAVYAFTNAFLRTPTSQLVSGVGSVTDGLILRITTEGLFIDDDVRGVPQREWDVKAWTMKLVEVWCPSFRPAQAGVSASASPSARTPSNKTFRRLWGLDKEKVASSEETDALLVDMLSLCKNNCRLRPRAATASVYSASSCDDSAYYGSSAGSSSPSRDSTNKPGVASQTGEMKNARLHVLRASIRDQEGKRYVFIIGEEESWKVAGGLQRLRKGTQVRALGVSGMSSSDARGTLENLGWT